MTFIKMNWKPRHDERNREHAVAPILVNAEAPEDGSWRTGPVMCQPADGPCVGYAIAAAIPAQPADADRIYAIAKTLDTRPGEAYGGTSVLAGAKAAKALDLIESYHWCFTPGEVVDTLRTLGPVVLGLQWTTGMKRPHLGLMSATGPSVGGHATLAIAYTEDLIDGPAVLIQNSWGNTWGENGRAWLPVRDLARLMTADGEACLVVPA